MKEEIINGTEYWKWYDNNGNLIHYKDSDGFERWKGYDKNGWPYIWGRHEKAIFQGKEYDIEEVDGKMITLSDGKRHRLSSCILVDKFAGGEY